MLIEQAEEGAQLCSLLHRACIYEEGVSLSVEFYQVQYNVGEKDFTFCKANASASRQQNQWSFHTWSGPMNALFSAANGNTGTTCLNA